MPTINILIKDATPTGDVPLSNVSTPSIEFVPVRKAMAGYLRTAKPFFVFLIDGAGTANLAVTAAGEAYKAVEHFPGGITRYFLVTGAADYDDLVDINPLTLAPTAEPEAAWWAALAAAGGGALTSIDGGSAGSTFTTSIDGGSAAA